MQPEFPQLAVHVEVQKGAVLRGLDPGFQCASGVGDGAGRGIVGGGFDVRGAARAADVEDVDVAVDARAAGLAVAGAAVAREDEELAVAQGVDLGLSGDLELFSGFGRGVRPEGQGDDELVFVFRFGGGGDVVFEQTGLAPVGVAGPAFLVECALHECEERVPVGGNGESFEALVVVAPGLGVRGDGYLTGGVDGRAVGAEADAAVAVRDVGVRWLDGLEHLALGRELVDVRSVLVRDPEGAVGREDEAFGVDGDAFAPGPGLTEAVACEGRDREDGETRVGD